MSRKKQCDVVGRKNLRKLNEVREKIFDMGLIFEDINYLGLVNDIKKADELQASLLDQIYETEVNLKVSIFNFENPHLD